MANGVDAVAARGGAGSDGNARLRFRAGRGRWGEQRWGPGYEREDRDQGAPLAAASGGGGGAGSSCVGRRVVVERRLRGFHEHGRRRAGREHCDYHEHHHKHNTNHDQHQSLRTARDPARVRDRHGRSGLHPDLRLTGSVHGADAAQAGQAVSVLLRRGRQRAGQPDRAGQRPGPNRPDRIRLLGIHRLSGRGDRQVWSAVGQWLRVPAPDPDAGRPARSRAPNLEGLCAGNGQRPAGTGPKLSPSRPRHRGQESVPAARRSVYDRAQPVRLLQVSDRYAGLCQGRRRLQPTEHRSHQRFEHAQPLLHRPRSV